MKNYKKYRGITVLFSFIFLFLCLFILREKTLISIKDTLSFSLSSLYPSLFPFIFLSSLLNLSTASIYISKILSPILRYIFKLSENSATVFISALLFGYPLGAKLTSELIKENKIGKSEAARIICCCLSPGAPFCIMFVGGVLLKNIKLGFFMFLSIIISDLLFLFISGIKLKTPEKSLFTNNSSDFYLNINTSLQSSAKALINMALYVSVFRVIIVFLNDSGATEFLSKNLYFIDPKIKAAIFLFLFEVTGGISDALKIELPVSYICAGLSFGGLCMFFQLFSFFKKQILNLPVLIFARTLISVCAFYIFNLFIRLSPELKLVSMNFNSESAITLKGNFQGVMCLTLLFLFITMLTERKQNNLNLLK